MKKICAGVIAVALLCLSAGYYSRAFLEVVSVFSNDSKQSNFLEVLNDLKTARNQVQMGAKKTCVLCFNLLKDFAWIMRSRSR